MKRPKMSHIMSIGLVNLLVVIILSNAQTKTTEATCERGNARLVGGASGNVGILEVCNEGQWTTVCRDSVDSREANLICRHMGWLPIEAEREGSTLYDSPVPASRTVRVECSQSHRKFEDCPIVPLGSRGCSSTTALRCLPCLKLTNSKLFYCEEGVVAEKGVKCMYNDIKCNGIVDCIGGEDEHYCDACSDTEGEGKLRLVDGDSLREGRLEICMNGRWGTVCSSGFDTTDAEVVCRQLGFPTSRAKVRRFISGDADVPIWLDGVECTGTENNLLECSKRETPRCTHSHDIGVMCLPECTTDGDVRVVNGSGPHEGRVEVCYERRWGSVCDEGWDQNEASVICRQLGYASRGSLAFQGAMFGKSDVILNKVACSGGEERLFDCIHDVLDKNCTGLGGAGVSCAACSEEQYTCSMAAVNGSRCINSSKLCDGVIDCVGGEDEAGVRLVDGVLPVQGRVEYCSNGEWQTVCDDRWDRNEARVVCRQLGYESPDPRSEYSASFGQGKSEQSIYQRDFQCNGREKNISQCLTTARGRTCTHREDAAVVCRCTSNTFPCHETSAENPVCITELQFCDGIPDCPQGSDENDCALECSFNGEIRLVGGDSPNEGRVEICYRGRWGSVCDSSWDYDDATVVCKQLGFGTLRAEAQVNSFFGRREGTIHLDNVRCHGSEESIIECSRNQFGRVSLNCHDHQDDASVTCPTVCPDNVFQCEYGRVDGQTPPCITHQQRCDGVSDCHGGEDEMEHNCFCSPNGAVRLVGGTVPYRGRAEYCVNGRWLSVCSNRWDQREAAVVCRQLGYPSSGANTLCCGYYNTAESRQPIVHDNFYCGGNERNLSMCSRGIGSRCTWHAEVICSTSTQPFPCLNSAPDFESNVTELHFCDGKNDCSDGSDEPASCAQVCNEPGKVRLVLGEEVGVNKGRVEVCFGGKWGTICDDSWDYRDAQVVCRQLGFGSTGAIAYGQSRYNPGFGQVYLDDVNCLGTEQNINECSKRDYGQVSINCRSHFEDASVICPTICPDNMFQCHHGRIGVLGSPCISHSQRCNGVTDCIGGDDEMNYNCPCEPEGSVRLVDGIVPYRGRVEICRGSRWTSVCRNRWGTSEARVICRQLGYSSQGARAECCSTYLGAPERQPIINDQFNCRGNEMNITQCPISSSSSTCSHNSDANVICSTGLNNFLCQQESLFLRVSELDFCDGVQNCMDGSDEPNYCPAECLEPGEIRLINNYASNSTEGRVEICFGGEWGTICDSGWTYRQAQVVCRQLGLGTRNAIHRGGAEYGPGSGHVLINSVTCSGSEQNLTSCQLNTIGNVQSNCQSHQRDVSVICSVCPDFMLECSRGRVDGQQPPCVSTQQRCDGTIDCIGGDDEEDYNCPCEPDGSVRLVGSSLPYPFQGRVEYCAMGRWSTLCFPYYYGTYISRLASIVCRQLGYTEGNADGHTSSRYGSGPELQSIIRDAFDCSGNERNLSECRILPGRRGDSCTHSNDISLTCGNTNDEFVCLNPLPNTTSNVSLLQVCDGVMDCSNGTDETVCSTSDCNEPGKLRLQVDVLQRTGNGIYGVVEICIAGRWSTIGCTHTWQYAEAGVACRQLGYATIGSIGSSTSTSERQPLIGSVDCRENESNIWNCSRNIIGNFTAQCGSSVATITCSSECPEDTIGCSDGRWDGRSPACVSLEERCDGIADCIGGEDELPHNCPCSPEGDVRLVDGIVPQSGRVELCLNGYWLTPCIYRWDSSDAAVVCNQLGYSRQGAQGSNIDGSGHPSQPVYPYYIYCFGGEMNLLECRRSSYRSCTTQQDATVTCTCLASQRDCPNEFQVCDGRNDTTNGSDEGSICYNECSRPGEVRLVDGERTDGPSGRVEICFRGRWSGVCDTWWDNQDAKVVCRQLGFNSIGATGIRGSYYGPGSGLTYIDRIQCRGEERNLTQCRRDLFGISLSCTSYASVHCQTDTSGVCEMGSGLVSGDDTLNDDREDEYYCAGSCSVEGAVRLVGGRTSHEGRVEVCSEGQWARMCDRQIFTSTTARVICRQLGYPTQNVYTTCCTTRFGPRNVAQATTLEIYHCSGNEHNITECRTTPNNINCGSIDDTIVACNCPDPKDVPCQVQNSNGTLSCISELKLCDGKVDCPQGTDEEDCSDKCTTPGSVRLVDSSGSTIGVTEGRVEACFNGEWGIICTDSWDHLDAQVVCRQLGFGSLGASGFSRPYYSSRRYHVLLDDVQCTGLEETLFSCPRRPILDFSSNCIVQRTSASVLCRKVCSFGTFQCQLNQTHSECIPDSKRCDGIKDCLGGVDELDHNCPCAPEGSVRLVDGIVPYRGRVEICVDSTWSTICSIYSWDSNEASVVCRQLGYDSGEEDSPCCRRRFPQVTRDEQPVIYDLFNCDGTESNITQCQKRRGSICSHSNDVSVICSSDTEEFLCREKNSTQKEVSELQYCDGTIDCSDGSDETESCGSECKVPGEIRLVDDYGRMGGLRGRVEICFGGTWGVICSNNQGYHEAEVMCKQLGFASRGATGFNQNFNPTGSSRVHIEQLVCERTEQSLLECNSRPFGVSDNNCLTRPFHVACRSVCPDNTTECQYGRVDGVVPPCISNNKLCDGVQDCIGGDDELDYNCLCTQEGAVRLVNGNSPHQGRLEFCNGGLWSTICDQYSWGISEASVVCRQLGYHTSGLIRRSTFGNPPAQQHQELDVFRCRGNEANLSECQRERGRSTCSRHIEILCNCPDARTSPCLSFNNTVSHCVSQFHLCDGNKDCPSGSDETQDCSNECSNPGEMRLVKYGKVGGNEGRVEICMKGKWGTICDEQWTIKDAVVACRHLGFGSIGATPYSGAHFGPGKGPIHLTQFRCIGFEKNLSECEGYTDAVSSRCNHFNDASVYCPTVCPDNQFMCSYGRQDSQQPACLTTEELCDGVRDCSEGEDELDYNCPCSPDGAVRLVDGILPHQGRLEACWDRRWITTCNRNNGDYLFPATVCRQLGFPTEDAELLRCCIFSPGPENQPFTQDRFFCQNTAQNITDCTPSEVTYRCDHNSAVSVTCDCPQRNHFPCMNFQGNITCVSELQYCDGVLDCADGSDEPNDCLNECSRPGQLQLVNGADTTGYEGRLEVCFKGQWGTVCQDNWDYFDTEVACRQLGLGTIEAVSYSSSRYGRGVGLVFLNNLQCSGRENTLTECHRSLFGRNVFTCNDHSKDISISCGKCPDISMFECKSGRRDEENPPCISREQRCDNVTDCLEGEDELPHNCPCSPEGAVQLVGGSGPHEGRVEFCWKTVWVTICARYFGWGSTNAGVVCHQLGYPRQGALAQRCCSNFGSGPTTQPIYPAFFSCIGREEELNECNERLFTQCTSHSDDIGVICPVE